MATKMPHHIQRGRRTLDPYLVPEDRPKAYLLFVTVNVNSTRDPARSAIYFKVDQLAGVVRDLMTCENYALDSRLHDEIFMKGIAESEDEYKRLKRLAHRTGRIKEQGVINGAWVVADHRS